MRLKEYHDFTDRLLIRPTRGNPLDALGANTVELQQAVRLVLDDVEYVLTKGFHELLGKVRADAPDHAAAEVLLDTIDGTGRQHLEEGRPKLHTVITVIVPPSTALDELAGLNGCGGTQDGSISDVSVVGTICGVLIFEGFLPIGVSEGNEDEAEIDEP